ncbi:dTDP-glucose 4,6-dehydratase [endosymbiont 'TC1' of Trimyema compressum]|uniref:dTDP-glucose 4,6-dehydratase n=1 Tax=endosymbiont 'TC1' of Trimyema compressum TaxID=243899 RepID=UPI000AFD73C0|nr:dTDP-glucose 4,6-dehydratase [endosymbiont 'TC1' of Trimyema compressum]
MNILVTGGAGFIGSHFIKALLRNPQIKNVVNLDCLRYGNNLFSLETVKSDNRYSFIEGNITNKELVDEIFKIYKINKVAHFAAESHVDKSLVDFEGFIKTNVLGTQVLLESAKKAWLVNKEGDSWSSLGNKKFLHISTDEVYGPTNSFKILFDETAPLNPSNPYATTKASADLVALTYKNNFNLPLNITRSTNNYGIFQFPDKLIPKMIIKGLKGELLPVYGKGQEVREWLSVEDHVNVLVEILFDSHKGEIYNIASGIRKKNIEVVELIVRILGLPKSRITFVKNRLFHDKAYSIDDSKLNKLFNFEPNRSFQLEMEKIISWYCRNEKWWSKFI